MKGGHRRVRGTSFPGQIRASVHDPNGKKKNPRKVQVSAGPSGGACCFPPSPTLFFWQLGKQTPKADTVSSSLSLSLLSLSVSLFLSLMASDNGNAEDTSQHEAGSQGSHSPGGGAAPLSGDEEKAVGAGVSEQIEPFNNIPVFLDRTYRMVENVPDDIVCWSDAGDSFIIKQASERGVAVVERGRWPRICAAVPSLFFYEKRERGEMVFR